MPAFPVLHYLCEFAQTHIHWGGSDIQPSRPLLPSSPALNLSQHQGLSNEAALLGMSYNTVDLEFNVNKITIILKKLSLTETHRSQGYVLNGWWKCCDKNVTGA